MKNEKIPKKKTKKVYFKKQNRLNRRHFQSRPLLDAKK
jgi:hypothetical protein